MYLRDLTILNSGALADLTLRAPFNADGTPKPIVLVGSNGSGKTGLLAVVADALIEIAALGLQGVTPFEGLHRQFFRVLGGRSRRLAATFEIEAASFEHGGSKYVYRSKAGMIDPEELAARMSPFGPLAKWPIDKDDKAAIGPAELVGDIYNDGVFPVDRFELPYWMNLETLIRDPLVDFTPKYSDRLQKPIVVQTAFTELKSWILGLIADMNLNLMEAMMAPTIETVRAIALHKMATSAALNGLQTVLSAILKSQVRVARLQRGQGDQRICIAAGDAVLIPTLENLSSGQASLLSIFGTILRDGDFGPTPKASAQINGIVLIDEADAHLHADLQHEVLPALIKLFPRLQFIVTSHSPLFLLGMRKTFGDDGFSLIEMPSGTTIDAERFTEFETSFAYFQATKAFEQSVKDRITATNRPLVLCEGETDPKYLKAGAELLGRVDGFNQHEPTCKT